MCIRDSGYSGTNFERPQVQKLIELVRANQIDCIIAVSYTHLDVYKRQVTDYRDYTLAWYKAAWPWMGCMGFLVFLGFLPKHGGGRNYLFFVFFAFFAWFFWGLPVSYTHLDVYKRQGEHHAGA